ncbi:hypothetical protein BJX65DRAFT_312809 [Aspergillus insuetus]
MRGWTILFVVAFAATRELATVYPARYQHFSNYVSYRTQKNNKTPCITLTTEHPELNLDYGVETGGYPFIRALGARTVQQACFEAGTGPFTWEVGRDGALIRGQQPAQSVRGATGFANYTFSFQTKIVRGGTGWKVAVSLGGQGTYCVVTSEYPLESTFLNTDRTLLPANALTVVYGWNLVNHATLESGSVRHHALPRAIKEHTWHFYDDE